MAAKLVAVAMTGRSTSALGAVLSLALVRVVPLLAARRPRLCAGRRVDLGGDLQRPAPAQGAGISNQVVDDEQLPGAVRVLAVEHT